MAVPDLPTVDADVEVLIVGGGPVGLTARALLERWGVRTLLVEKYGKLSPFPRSRLVNTRTMEIFRQLGLDSQITDRAFAPGYGRVRFRDTLQDNDFASAAMIGINAAIPESPVTGVVSSQDRLEPILLAAADTPVRYGVELIDLAEDHDGVAVLLADHQRGEETRLRARYVLAADGANSTVRQRLGIDTVGPGTLGDFTTVVFDADLDRWCAGQPAGVYFTAHGSFLPVYPEGCWAWAVPTPEDPTHADWAELVSRALGSEVDVPVDVLRVQHWVVNASIAERFRHGRILLAGDAAHAIPPAGGLGMNTGIADVHNLCWKLAGVLRGWAGPGLVETYEPERLPVAHQTLRQAVANSHLMAQAQNKRREQLQSDEPEPAEIELPWSERYFAQLDLVLGTTYHSDAVLTDSTPPVLSDTGTDYVPTAKPGHRMPHVRLAENRSTLDTVGEWFTLLTPDPSLWEKQKATPWPLHIESLPDEHTDVFDLGPQGALLVRPDGHISAHWRDCPPSDSALHDALTATTGS